MNHILPNDDGVRPMFEAMDEADLAIQQIATEGAITALSFLLRHQCHPLIAAALFDALRTQLELVREVAQEKGFTPIAVSVNVGAGLH